MTVSLSPVGGAASQFFNSGGVPLYGGKIYTYEAGTTTPKACFTEANGLTAHTNPIILDSAGRVPGGEIWLTSAQAYLFILKTSSDETIGTYDNIYGYSAGAENAVTEVQVATAGQTSFTLTSMIYTPTTHTLGVYIDGVNQVVNNSYVETSATTVTFVSGLHVGAVVKFININSAATSSDLVTYLPAGAGAVATTVQDKLRESVSVLDFGAVGDGVTDDTVAIQLALNTAFAAATPARIHFPAGTYLISSTLNVYPVTHITGDGRWSTIIKAGTGFTGIMMQDTGNAAKIILEDFQLFANSEAGVTNLLDLGNNGATWGTEGYVRGLILRAAATNVTIAGTIGFNVKCNVTDVDGLSIWYCASGVVETANSVASSYNNVYVVGATTYGMYVHHANLLNIEIEAPSAACVGIYATRSAAISKLVYSQAASTTNPYAIELDSGLEAFSLGQMENYVNTGSVLTDVIKDNRSAAPALYWGDFTGTGARKVTNVSDQLSVGRYVAVQNQQLQCFSFALSNNAGTLQHKFTDASYSALGSFTGRVNAASSTYQTTPTGADASTAMAYGGKISTVASNTFIFDTDDQVYTNGLLLATIEGNTTGTALMCSVYCSNINVNGVTQKRVTVKIVDATTGANFVLSTGNIGVGLYVQVRFLGFIQ